jgi:hypothetical protein
LTGGDTNALSARLSSRFELVEVYIAGDHIAAALGLRRTRYHAGQRKRSAESVGGQRESELSTLAWTAPWLWLSRVDLAYPHAACWINMVQDPSQSTILVN